MHTTSEPSRPASSHLLDRTLCTFAIFAWIFVAYYIPTDRARFIHIAQDFGIALPTTTKLMLSIPDLAFATTAILAALSCWFVQYSARTPAGACAWHLFVLLLAAVVLVCYRESTYWPLQQLITQLRRP